MRQKYMSNGKYMRQKHMLNEIVSHILEPCLFKGSPLLIAGVLWRQEEAPP